MKCLMSRNFVASGLTQQLYAPQVGDSVVANVIFGIQNAIFRQGGKKLIVMTQRQEDDMY